MIIIPYYLINFNDQVFIQYQTESKFFNYSFFQRSHENLRRRIFSGQGLPSGHGESRPGSRATSTPTSSSPDSGRPGSDQSEFRPRAAAQVNRSSRIPLATRRVRPEFDISDVSPIHPTTERQQAQGNTKSARRVHFEYSHSHQTGSSTRQGVHRPATPYPQDHAASNIQLKGYRLADESFVEEQATAESLALSGLRIRDGVILDRTPSNASRGSTRSETGARPKVTRL